MTCLDELAGNALSAGQKDQAAAECFRKKKKIMCLSVWVFYLLSFLM